MFHIKSYMVQIVTILRPFKVTEFLYTHRHVVLGRVGMYDKASVKQNQVTCRRSP